MQNLGVLLFPNFELLDVTGPLEMFGQLKEIKIQTIAQIPGPVVSNQGVAIHATYSLDEVINLDMLLVPGGQGVRVEVANQTLLNWLSDSSQKVRLLMSVCTGAALLAKAGCLDDCSATTNKRAFDWVMLQSERVKWIRKARWVEAGSIYTASGVAAGIDMSLAVIAKLFGNEKAEEIAQITEYVWNKDSEKDCFCKM